MLCHANKESIKKFKKYTIGMGENKDNIKSKLI